MLIETINVTRNNNRARIVFKEFVCWNHNSEKIVEIQKSIEDEYIDLIEVDFNDVVWFDKLMLCQLCLYLEKAIDHKKQIEVFLLDRDNIEHVRFVKFLKDAGFVSFMDRITLGIENKVNTYLRYADMNYLQKGDFNSSEMILPFRILKEEKGMDDLIEEAIGFLNERNLEENSISFRLKIFLQEVLGNVYEHAYEDGEIPYCGILICRKIRRAEDKVSVREYNIDSGLNGKVNYDRYNSFIFSNNFYRISKFSDVRVDYIQVYVVDIGKGILEGIQCKDPKKEMVILNQIFTTGKRINKRNKNTQAGGLYMLHNIMSVTADALGIKSDYNLIPIECERNDFATVKYNGLYTQGYEQIERIRGFSVVGYLNILGNVTKEYRKYFRRPDVNCILNVYRNHCFEALNDDTMVVDYRFPGEDNIIQENVKNIIILVERETSKNKLVSFLEDCLCSNKVENVIIGDFTDVEISKYYMIFLGMKLFAKKVILISRSYSASVFSKDNRNSKTTMRYNQEITQQYVQNELEQKSPFESIYGYMQWLINYESKLFWKFLNNYQINSFQNMYIKGKLKWNYQTEKFMTTYLDFSQASFVRECKALFIIQLFRIISIYGTKIYFVSGERFSEDICELANAELGTKAENKKIFIGSAYVTGTSSLKQNIIQKEMNNDWFYFFNHIDYEGEEKVLALLNWEEPEELGELSEELEYERIEETPFIARGGVDFFRQRQFVEECDGIIKMPGKRMYEYFQEPDSWENKICSFGHVDLVGPHDSIILNTVEMFKRDRLESYTQPKVLDTAYDFLLFNFYSALGRKKDLPLVETVDKDFCSQLISSNATKEKIVEYSKMCKNAFQNEEGVLLHFTDYATTEIVSYFQRVFNDTLNYRIIPIALISRERGAASLLLSPLLVDSLQEFFSVLKKQNKEKCRVTIFSAMLISTKLIDELKHVMFRIGAEEVNVITLIDRQRLPFGYSAKESTRTLWKLDVPPLGNKKNCALCNGISNLKRLRVQLGIESICSRISEVVNKWKHKRAFDKKLSVIESKNIQIPDSIKRMIEKQVVPYQGMKGIEITTDIGLVLFSVEDTTVTRSLKFLKECIKSELDEDTKILMLCAHLGLFKKVEISEKRQYELVLELYECLKKQDRVTNYSALALIILASQEKSLLFYLKDEINKDTELQNTYQNLDALICGIFVLWLNEDTIDSRIEYYFKSSRCSLPEKLNAIFFNTCGGCRNTHSGTLIRMYNKGANFQYEDYQEAYYRIVYLKDIYGNFPINILNDPTIGHELLENVNRVLEIEEQVLAQYLETKEEFLVAKIMDCNNEFMNCAEQLNGLLFRKSTEDLQNELEKVKQKVIKGQNDEKIKEALEMVVVEWPYGEKNYEYWYLWTSDVISEISYLMLDFRYLKQRINYCMPVTCEKREVTAIVEAKFKDRFLELHFKNGIAPEASIKEIRDGKLIKYNRPTILRIKELMKNVSDEIFEFNFSEIDGQKILDACLKIPYIYARKK